ncbi:hypothetical protein DL240_15995 [Lujinxingia litoralis]|uniref:Enoyl-CoA hydratase/isomerase family protein n=1 Tax=Lujinxingia litoralis TaxID=2211119 RepID=A0A328C6C2_9DELT|nr:enoyl-CoA hydratase/isomerase family protein [Lujinxingia litoralis]RAL20541.1 hypothetical protein DL240_15995 [Lujinxingia litoralis]
MNRPAVFTASHDDRGLLRVCMNTPGSEVNIFSAQAAHELVALMANINPERTRAVVFTSGKERSFINGAQLMLASAVQSPGSIFALTALLRQAYQAVHSCPVPTIAVVTGSCYGCGVEFSLNCDVRLALDSPDATFYMTEIADYLNTPAFGSTQRLPRMMGLHHGLGFLLWGHRLWGARALEQGLIDALLPIDDTAAAIETAIDALLQGTLSPHTPVVESTASIEQVEAHTRARIAQLPTEYHRVYTRCLELMVHAAHRAGAPPCEDDFRRELTRAGETLVEPQAQAARSFLYLRQVAERVHVRRTPPRRDLLLELDGADDGAASALLHELHQRPLRRVHHPDTAPPALDSPLPITLLDPDRPRPLPLDDACTIAVHAGPPGSPLPDSPNLELRRPLPALSLADSEQLTPGTGTRPLLELRLPEKPVPALAHVFEWLDAAGFCVIFTRARDRFLSDRFLLTTLCPLVTAAAEGVSVADIEATLTHIGMVPSPLTHLRQNLTLAELTPRLAADLCALNLHDTRQALNALQTPAAEPGEPNEHLAAAIHLHLLHLIETTRASRELAHPTIADVIARELLGYPVGRTSLCEYLRPDTVARLASPFFSGEAPAWVSPRMLDAVRAFIDQNRPYYA